MLDKGLLMYGLGTVTYLHIKGVSMLFGDYVIPSNTQICMCVRVSSEGVEADCNFTVPTLTAWEGSDSPPVNLAYYSALQLLMLRGLKPRVGGAQKDGSWEAGGKDPVLNNLQYGDYNCPWKPTTQLRTVFAISHGSQDIDTLMLLQ